MAEDLPAELGSRRWRLFVRVALAAAALLAISMAIIILGVGRWLFVEDPLEKAEAVAVLSGRMPVRALEAARLYHAGYAPQVWLTRTNEPTKSLQTLHVAYIGEDFYNTQVLMHEGVASNAIRVIEPQIDNTADEIEVIADELERQKRAKVILVTTKAHTRRVRALWKKLSRGRGQAIVRGAGEDRFDPAHWWRNSSDALDVVREVLGLLNTWAGLPLRPQANGAR